MKTKAVYILTGSRNDYYYEQLLISVYSLKLHNQNMPTALVTDTVTNCTFVPGHNKIKEYFDEIIVVDIPARFSQLQRSRYLKTSLRQLVEGDILYIDLDTIICGSLSEIDKLNVEIGAVPSGHHTNSLYYNSGVMYSKDRDLAHSLYNLWHKLWLENVDKGIVVDQPVLDVANRQLGCIIQEIPAKWNCQLLLGGIRNIENCKIAHYFASQNSDYIFKIGCILEIVRAMDDVPDMIKQLITNPKNAFSDRYFRVRCNEYPYLWTLMERLPRYINYLDKCAHVILFMNERSNWLKRKLSIKRK